MGERSNAAEQPYPQTEPRRLHKPSRRFILGGAALSLLLTACGESTQTIARATITPGSINTVSTSNTNYYSGTTKNGVQVRIGLGALSGDSIETDLCAPPGSKYLTVASLEKQGDSRDSSGRRWLVSEVHSVPTGNSGSEANCLTTYTDIKLAQGQTTEDVVYVGVGVSPDSSFQKMEVYDIITTDGNSNLTIKDLGQQTIDPTSIDTSQANP